MKKAFYIISSILMLLILNSCTSASLYYFNYPDDPQMQQRMEKEYGNKLIGEY